MNESVRAMCQKYFNEYQGPVKEEYEENDKYYKDMLQLIRDDNAEVDSFAYEEDNGLLRQLKSCVGQNVTVTTSYGEPINGRLLSVGNFGVSVQTGNRVQEISYVKSYMSNRPLNHEGSKSGHRGIETIVSHDIHETIYENKLLGKESIPKQMHEMFGRRPSAVITAQDRQYYNSAIEINDERNSFFESLSNDELNKIDKIIDLLPSKDTQTVEKFVHFYFQSIASGKKNILDKTIEAMQMFSEGKEIDVVNKQMQWASFSKLEDKVHAVEAIGLFSQGGEKYLSDFVQETNSKLSTIEKNASCEVLAKFLNIKDDFQTKYFEDIKKLQNDIKERSQDSAIQKI